MLNTTPTPLGAATLGLLFFTLGCGTDPGDLASDPPASPTPHESAVPRRDSVPTEAPAVLAAHGRILLEDGTFAPPSVELALSAQAYYMSRLLNEANEATRAEFESVRRSQKADPAAGDAARAVANAHLIDWLIQNVRPWDAAQLTSLNVALVSKIEVTEEAADDGIGTLRSAFTTSTGDRGQAYVDTCLEAGVPTPPDWGSDEWVEQVGVVTPDFLQLVGPPIVFVHESDDPRGVCMALPRIYQDQLGQRMAGALGIICQGNDTSKACFWDLKNDRDIPVESSHPIVGDAFVGGADLPTMGFGVCTDCHAGENAFIIHPGSKLDLGDDLVKAKGWVNPLVVPSWPQNRRPGRYLERLAIPDTLSCVGECHNKFKHNRFPRLDGNLMGYCLTVGVDALFMNRTMPPAPYDPDDFTGQALAMVAGCGPLIQSTRFGGSWPALGNFSSSSLELAKVGDFNNDGKADLVKFVFGSASDVYVAVSNGGTFAAPAKWHDNFVGDNNGVNVGDFDGDGLDDIMYVFNSANVFAVAKSHGSGFGPAAQWWNGTPVYGAYQVGDINNDGKDDVIVLFGRTVASATSTDVYVALSTGTGFQPPVPFASGFATSGARYEIGDVNGDGFDDIVKFTGGSSADVFVLLSKGDGFEPPQQWHDSFAAGTAIPRVADVTGDGFDDIVSFTRGGSADVHVAASNGQSFGTRKLWQGYFSGGSSQPLLGDYDADGDADGIAVYQDWTATVYTAAAIP